MEYDGSARVRWLADELASRRDERALVERLLCRVCDPREYDDGLASAEEFRNVLNDILELEGLAVVFVGRQPVVAELGHDGLTPFFSAPPDLEQRIRSIIRDDRTVAVLSRRAAETVACEQVGAHTMAIIGIGSLIEGVLMAVLQEHGPADQTYVDRNGKAVSSSRPTLEQLIDTAHARNLIQLDAKDFMHKVRDYRNYVHPRKELAEQPAFDADSVRLCWGPVQAVLNDLEQHTSH
ncbi:hypothetical protein [Fodinicola acaciae]|uniref:hypothetical protein n=1 Tax=Fodinicola acaciae TaxID=2681555 RepID=UPI001C9E9CBF|nr:hypothetical protein [Fodinicola acaciae]